MSTRKKAVSSMIGGLAVNTIQPYKNTDTITFDNLDVKYNLNGNLSQIESTRDISDNNNIIDKTYFVKFDNTNKQVLLSEDETNWFNPYTKLELYVDATYTFIQKNKDGYNNSSNPFLISTRNIYEKPRLFPLYNDGITYWVEKSGNGFPGSCICIHLDGDTELVIIQKLSFDEILKEK